MMTEKLPESAGARLAYERNPEAIYAASFAAIRARVDLERFEPGFRPVALRLAHAAAETGVIGSLAHSAAAVSAARRAIADGAPILCDCEMAAAGISRRLLPAGNDVVVTLNDASVPALARRISNTRSAAAVRLWRDRIDSAVVAVGNAPTALFHLLELLDSGWPKPACVLAFPVGFVGAAESKAELVRDPRGCEYITLAGRRGGSALAAAAVNALAAIAEDGS